MNVLYATDADAKRWDAYIMAHQDSTFYHQYGWRVAVSRNYGLTTHYLLAEENERVTGVLPLTEIKPIAGARVLNSLAFANYGGLLADSATTASSLLTEARELMKRRNAAYLELKQVKPFEHPQAKSKLHYFSLVLPLDSDPEVVWKEKLNVKVRNQVRKAQKSDISANIGPQYLDAFINVYQRNMRDLGTPTHRRKWYETLADVFQGKVHVVAAIHSDSVIAAALMLEFKKTLILHSAASNKKYLRLCPNNLIYWKAIEFGCLHGCERLDFARSRENSGTFHFKRQWGAEPEQTHYQYFLNRVDTIPDMDPQNPRYAPATAIWKCLPVPIANILGPIVRSRITT
jgi:FemAB-related protein (PEP-CTERM system-associated)